MTLVMALLMMVVLTSVSTTTIYFVTSNVHSTGISKASTSAYDVAEAGLNDSVAKMYNQLDTDGSILASGIDPRSSTMFPSCVGAPPPAPTSISYTNVGGTALICGDYNATKTATTITVGGVSTPLAGYSWRIQSTGRVSSGGKMQTRTLSKSLKVVGLNDGADGSTWSRFYQDSTASCLTINNMTFVTNVATRGDLCLKNNGTITGANSVVDVGGDVSIVGNNTPSGPRAATVENATWTSPTNIATSNNTDATNTIAATTTGLNLDATGFGFAIPATAMIAGITASVERGTNPGANAVQTISETGSPTAGTFTITGTPPGGSARTSVSLARTAPATGTSSVQTALEGIYGVGNVTCSGGPLPARRALHVRRRVCVHARRDDDIHEDGLLAVRSDTGDRGHDRRLHPRVAGQHRPACSSSVPRSVRTRRWAPPGASPIPPSATAAPRTSGARPGRRPT